MSRPPQKYVLKPQAIGTAAAPQQQAKLAALFSQGLALHQQGKLAQAKQIYAQVLALQPTHFDALHLSGVIAAQSKNPKLAVELIGKAIAINPNNSAYYSNRGNALKELGCCEEAVASYDRAIKIKPDYADAYYNRGIALQELKRLEEAVASFDRAIQIKPDYASACSNRGIALQELKRLEEAVASFDRAIQIKPDLAEAYSNRGTALQELKRSIDAVASYDSAIKINPDYVDAHYNRGVALKDLKRYEEAVVSFDRAIQLKPDYAEAYSDRGAALQELTRLEDAVASYDRAIEIIPNYADAHYNRGIVLKELKRYEDAIVSYDNAIQINLDSENPKFYYNKALLLLQLQKFAEGWNLYQRRWEIKHHFSKKLNTNIPYWNRQNTKSESKILLWAEQGIGDQIFYFGMLKNFADIDARVTLSTDTRLHALFKRSMPELEFVDRKEINNICDENAFDFQAPIGDIGQLFSVNKSLEHKTPKPFFQIDQSRCSDIKNKNSFLSGKFVCGISWKSNNKDIGIAKSLNLIDLSPLLSIENVVFVSLQYGSTADEIEFVEKNIGIKIHTIDGLDIFNDIDGLVSLISLCDLVVTTSNITAHLTGAIGKKGMVLMPFSKGKIWYWHSGVGPSLWYPSLEMVSQLHMNDWTDPINKCKEWVLGQL